LWSDEHAAATDRIIERWYPQKRFGFIRPTGALKATTFFHESEASGDWDIAEGLAVSYDVTSSPKGARATNVEAA